MSRLRLAAALFLCAPPCGALFDNTVSGARAAAMSGAFTAVADDASALAYNPAGLFQIDKPQIAAQYASLQTPMRDGLSLGHTFLSWAQKCPALGGGIGAAWSSLTLSNLYEERFLSLAYSKTLINGRLSVGAAYKNMSVAAGEQIYSRSALDSNGAATRLEDPVLAGGRKKSASAFDLSLMVKIPASGWTGGLALQNVNQPDLGLAETVRVPRVMRLGAAWRRGSLLAAMEMSRRLALQGVTDTEYAAGVEKALASGAAGAFFARGGLRFGTRNLSQSTMGFGWAGAAVRADYSLLIPLSGLEPGQNTHRITLSWLFNWPYRIHLRVAR